MSETRALALNPQEVADISLVDLAYQILKTTNKPFHYRDLMQEVARLKGLTEEQVNEVIARLYTEINIDGRFVCIGGNVWGLKRWYPTDKAAETKATGGKKFVRKDLDDDDDFYDDEDDAVDEIEDEDEPFGEYDDAEEEADVEGFEDEELADDEEEVEAEAEEDEEELDAYEDDDF